MSIAFTVTVGTYTDDGVPVRVLGGPWRCGQPSALRVSLVKVFAAQSTRTWSGKGWG